MNAHFLFMQDSSLWFGAYFSFLPFFIHLSPFDNANIKDKTLCNAWTYKPNELSQVYHKAFEKPRNVKGLWKVEDGSHKYTEAQKETVTQEHEAIQGKPKEL